MVTKGLTSDHMKYCELRSCAKGGGGGVTLRRVANLLRFLALQLWWEKHGRQVNSLRCARHEW
jgi:hypothetical protein